jgi:SAM-dependent methyltransferase
MKPRPAPQITFTYDRLLKLANIEDWHFWFVGRTSWLKYILEKYLIHCEDWVLDLGCGTGKTLRLLEELEYQVVGLDLRPEGLRSLATPQKELNLVQADAANIPFATDRVGSIVMLDVFEHVDAKITILEISRVLKPGGWLILTVPAMDWLWSYRDHAAGHKQRFTKRKLKDLLATTKIQPVEICYYQFFLFPLVIFTRFLARWMKRVRDLEEVRFPLINDLFAMINRLEVRLGHTIPWPWGSSIFAIFQKQDFR